MDKFGNEAHFVVICRLLTFNRTTVTVDLKLLLPIPNLASIRAFNRTTVELKPEKRIISQYFSYF